MAGLEEPNFDLFGSFGLEFLEELTKRTTEQRSDNFIAKNRNKNTTKKTQSDLNVFYRWAKTVNQTRTMENIPEQELDKVLAHFFF